MGLWNSCPPILVSLSLSGLQLVPSSAIPSGLDVNIYNYSDLSLLSPAVYDTLRFFSLCRRRITRNPHDQDFRYFERHQKSDGLFVDVGANGGQAAVAFAMFNRRAKILSFEPNPAQARRHHCPARVAGAAWMIGAAAARMAARRPRR